MGTTFEFINSIGGAFVRFAWPVFVQSSAVIVLLLAADLVLRERVRAVRRYWLWMLVFVALVLPAPPLARITRTALVGTSGRAMVALAWQGWVLILWAAGMLVMAAFLIRRALAMHRLVSRAREANGFMRDVLKYCCKCMGVKRTVRLKVSVDVDGPVVCGLIRPVIVMPHDLAPTLGSRHLRAILLHELAHVKRADQWVNLAQTVLQVVYFYNPLLWLANRTIRNLRDQAVDETVLATMGEKVRWYPETLAGLASFVSEPSAFGAGLIGVVESQSVMARRITSAPNPPARERVLSAV